jgi:hypothetical protein
MTAFSLILLILVVGAAIIAIVSSVKPWPLWVAVLLLSIAIAIVMLGGEHIGYVGK